jgi:hypothetical protein
MSEREGYKDTVSESGRERIIGLQKFIEAYREKLTRLSEKILQRPDDVPLPMVLLKFDGPTTFNNFPWPKNTKTEKIDKFLVDAVYPTLFCSGYKIKDKRKKGPLMDNVLADHLFYLHANSQPTTFFQTMHLLDPIADGNCGFIVLQCFNLFLQERSKMTIKALRKFIVEELKKNIDYFRKSDVLLSFYRNPVTTDKEWEQGKEVAQAGLDADLLDESEGLFDIGKRVVEGEEEVVQLDCRHLEVYAKATSTRIVVLRYWKKERQFACIDIDWRRTEENESISPTINSSPRLKYSVGLPNFGKDDDYYRTAVIMHCPTIEEVVKGTDRVIWSNDSEQHGTEHFTMWLPENYDPSKKTKQKEQTTEEVVSPIRKRKDTTSTTKASERTTVRKTTTGEAVGLHSLSSKTKEKRRDMIQAIAVPLPSKVLTYYQEKVTMEENGPVMKSSYLTWLPPVDGQRKGAAICAICEKEISTGNNNKPFVRGMGNKIMIVTGDDTTSGQREYINDHIEKEHPNIRFALMENWKNVQEPESADMKSLIQEALFTASKTVGGINMDVIADLLDTKSDEKLKRHLWYIFGGALVYVKHTLLNNLKKRNYMLDWLARVHKKNDKKKVLEARKMVDKKIVETGDAWIRMMTTCFAEFDYVHFLQLFDNSNWRCMWNSLVYFFCRGMYFQHPYPPVMNDRFASMIENENFNIVEELDRVLNDIVKETNTQTPTKKQKK